MIFRFGLILAVVLLNGCREESDNDSNLQDTQWRTFQVDADMSIQLPVEPTSHRQSFDVRQKGQVTTDSLLGTTDDGVVFAASRMILPSSLDPLSNVDQMLEGGVEQIRRQDGVVIKSVTEVVQFGLKGIEITGTSNGGFFRAIHLIDLSRLSIYQLDISGKSIELLEGPTATRIFDSFHVAQ